MLKKITGKLGSKSFLFLALAWLLVWMLPWASWLNAFPWLRLALAISLFIAPGTALSFILAGNRLTLLAHFISGLSLSFCFVGVLGVVGRILNLPFAFIRPVFILAGLIAAGALVISFRGGRQFYKPKNFGIVTTALLVCIVIAGVVISLLSRFGQDGYSYLAYLTNWQHADRLNFQLVYSSTAALDSERFWLAMMPMNLAFLSEISGLHGLLLIGYYLGPILVTAAILVAYSLYEDLLRSEQMAISALLLQFTFLTFLLKGPEQQLGQIFFFRMTEDKAFGAFILAPVLFLAVRGFLDSHTIRTGIFVLLTGFSLALAHPVILAYGVFIAGVYTVLVTVPRKDYQTMGITIALLVVIILPMAPLRLAPLFLEKKPAFDLEAALEGYLIERRITFIEGTPFYGLNLERIKIMGLPMQKTAPLLQAFLSWSYLWLLGLGFMWSLFNLKKEDETGSFIAASSLLVIMCAIPYTGWLVGYFISARMLWRSPWLLPIGCIALVVVRELLRVVWKKLSPRIQSKITYDQVVFSGILLSCIALLGYFGGVMYRAKLQSLTRLDAYRVRLEHLSSLGDYLEASIEAPSTFFSTSDMMNLLPGLSSKAKVVFFRRNLMREMYVKDLQAYQLVFSTDPAISLGKRINVLKKYQVQYLLVNDPGLKDYYLRDPHFLGAQEFEEYWIIPFRETVP